jgi:hypothetical protein
MKVFNRFFTVGFVLGVTLVGYNCSGICLDVIVGPNSPSESRWERYWRRTVEPTLNYKRNLAPDERNVEMIRKWRKYDQEVHGIM